LVHPQKRRTSEPCTRREDFANIGFQFFQLGLPLPIITMAESLSLLSQEDLQQVEHVYQDSLRKFIALQALIRSEGNCQSPLLNGLKQAGTVALLRMRVCFSLRAAWRRLPIELWDRIFSHYLDNIRSGYPEAGIRTINKMATSAPRTLCLVSKFFNAVTQATSSIWKDMTVPTMEPPPDSSPLLVPIGNIGHILDRLNRVAATPHSSCLTISLDSDHDRDPAFRRAYDEDDEESRGDWQFPSDRIRAWRAMNLRRES
jgi:hypothetical protein